MYSENGLTENFSEIEAFVRGERAKVLSEAEWRFRMRGYGYNLRKTANGYEVARLPQNAVIGQISNI